MEGAYSDDALSAKGTIKVPFDCRLIGCICVDRSVASLVEFMRGLLDILLPRVTAWLISVTSSN